MESVDEDFQITTINMLKDQRNITWMKTEKTLEQIKWKKPSKEIQTEISESIDTIGKKRTVTEKTKQNAAQREKDQT